MIYFPAKCRITSLCNSHIQNRALHLAGHHLHALKPPLFPAFDSPLCTKYSPFASPAHPLKLAQRPLSSPAFTPLLVRPLPLATKTLTKALTILLRSNSSPVFVPSLPSSFLTFPLASPLCNETARSHLSLAHAEAPLNPLPLFFPFNWASSILSAETFHRSPARPLLLLIRFSFSLHRNLPLLPSAPKPSASSLPRSTEWPFGLSSPSRPEETRLPITLAPWHSPAPLSRATKLKLAQ